MTSTVPAPVVVIRSIRSADVSGTTAVNSPANNSRLCFVLWAGRGTRLRHNVGKTVVEKLQDGHVSFRANDALISALCQRVRKSGCSVSEYLRSIVRDRVGLR